jgi:hypothetical protein
MMTNNRKPGWFFYPAWVVLSAISIPIAGAVSWVLISLGGKVVGGTIQVGEQTRITEDYLSTYILLLVLGLLAASLSPAPCAPYLFASYPLGGRCEAVVSTSWRLLRERGATRVYPAHGPVWSVGDEFVV